MGSGTTNGKPGYSCDPCQRVTVTAHRIEGFLEPIIVQRLRRDDAASLFWPATDSAAVAAATEELDQLQARLDEFRAEGAKLDGLSAAAVGAAERGLVPRISALRAKIRQLTVPPALAELEGVDVASEWEALGPHIRREIVRALADLVLLPSGRTGRREFDIWRLAASRWTGDTQTWGEIWRSQGSE